jgi:hypothetical protein
MLDTVIESIINNSLLLVYYNVIIQLYKLNNYIEKLDFFESLIC